MIQREKFKNGVELGESKYLMVIESSMKLVLKIAERWFAACACTKYACRYFHIRRIIK